MDVDVYAGNSGDDKNRLNCQLLIIIIKYILHYLLIYHLFSQVISDYNHI